MARLRPTRLEHVVDGERLRVQLTAAALDAIGSEAEQRALALEDFTIRTALLEARPLTGDEKLADDLRRRYRKEVADGTGAEFVAAKLKERDERHARAGASRYLVEPNVKEGKGGLRDLNTL